MENLPQAKSPSELIVLAINANTDMDKLAKALEIQERWEANEAKKAYNLAMADFKKDPPKIDKDKQVAYSQTKYKHASLGNVAEKINTGLSKHGLSASWTPKQNGQIVITCKITHKQGHSEEATLTAPSDTSGAKNSIQAIGSTITYLERYTLLALTGLATYDDDDGQAATQNYITKDQELTIDALLDEVQADKKKFLQYMGIESLNKLPADKYNKAVIAIQSKNKSVPKKGIK